MLAPDFDMSPLPDPGPATVTRPTTRSMRRPADDPEDLTPGEDATQDSCTQHSSSSTLSWWELL